MAKVLRLAGFDNGACFPHRVVTWTGLIQLKAISDKALGAAMMFTAAAVFVYYTTWAIVLPFFDASSPLHDLFPPREWAVRLPAFILVVGLSAIGLFIGSTIIKENRKKAEKAKLRAA